MYAQDSIDLLTRAGIDFNKNQVEGIDVNDFGETLMTSGIVLSDRIRVRCSSICLMCFLTGSRIQFCIFAVSFACSFFFLFAFSFPRFFSLYTKLYCATVLMDLLLM
jgi:CCR4-NOT transcription complex subunit 7/8